MKKVSWILGLFILAWSLLVLPAAAQTEVDRLARAQVDLWPDYDQAAVLVLMTVELPAETTLPAIIDFRLPGSVSQPSAVATITAAGEMFDAAYQIDTSGETTLLRVNTGESIVRVEYYYPYERDSDAVQFSYDWLGGTAVDDLIILVQEPAQATSLTTDPSLEDIGFLSDGWRYYQWQVGALERDETRRVNVSYVEPPFEASGALPSTAPSLSPGASEDGESILIPILTALGGLLIGLGIGWFLANRRAPIKRSSPRRRKTSYCSQCGSRLESGDRFCRQCGNKVR